jgi:FkbM family methyltransferase
MFHTGALRTGIHQMSFVSIHSKRVSYHLGRKLHVGGRAYKVKGYIGAPLPNAGHEVHFFDLLKRLLQDRRGAFFDVGANAGQTMLKVLAADSRRSYFGFEPQLACCHGLEEILRLNEISNATILPIALSDRNGLVGFYSQGATDEMAGLVPPLDPQDRVTKKIIVARVGDEVVKELGCPEIAAIKIDVEGLELQVMRGLRDTLAQQRPALVFEVLPNFYGLHDRIMRPQEVCEANRAAASEIFALLSDLGYRVLQFTDDGREVPLASFELDDRTNFHGSNYVAYPLQREND